MHLITPSLYESWRWFHAIEDKPMDELVAALRKERSETNEAMQAGIDFENHVRGLTPIPPDADQKYKDCVSEVYLATFGALWQQTYHKPMKIGSSEYLLYCRADASKADWIYDVKFSGSFEMGKYFKSIQYLLTMYAADIEKFKYMIADGKTVYHEDYFWDAECEPLLRGRIAEMMQNIMDIPALREPYLANWQARDGS